MKTLALAHLRVGAPRTASGLTIYPLFTSASAQQREYTLATTAIGLGQVKVEELPGRERVELLQVTNNADIPVLFLEGDVLVGAKQNRVVNLSVLLAAHQSCQLPVSCVEQNRWRYKGSREFSTGGTSTTPNVRRSLREGVTQSTVAGGHHRSDQQTVWAAAANDVTATNTVTDTTSMNEVYTQLADELTPILTGLPFQPMSAGLVVALGDRLISYDLFDSTQTGEEAWERIVRAAAVEALATKPQGSAPTIDTVTDLVNLAQSQPWQRTDAIGIGEEYRYKVGAQSGIRLTYGNRVIHESVLAG